jgi:hypothetical protein
MMRKLPYLPDSDGYGFTDAVEAIMVQLDGGPPRVRSDMLNGPVMLQASWTLDRDEYEYMRAFYRVAIERYGGKFTCDLLIDSSVLTEHDCIFVPGSMKLMQQRGHMYVVGCTLVVTRKPMDIDNEIAIMDIIDIYGTEGMADQVLISLHELVNIRLDQL